MKGRSDETLSKKPRTDAQPPRPSFRVRSDSQSRCGRERPLGNSRAPEPIMQAGATGATTMTIRVRPLPERQISNRNRR